jgi:hypothetical protein
MILPCVQKVDQRNIKMPISAVGREMWASRVAGITSHDSDPPLGEPVQL